MRGTRPFVEGITAGMWAASRRKTSWAKTLLTVTREWRPQYCNHMELNSANDWHELRK